MLSPQLVDTDLTQFTDEEFARIFYACETLDGSCFSRRDTADNCHIFAIDLNIVLTEDARRNPRAPGVKLYDDPEHQPIEYEVTMLEVSGPVKIDVGDYGSIKIEDIEEGER